MPKRGKPEIPRPEAELWRVLDNPIGDWAQQGAWEVRNTRDVKNGDEFKLIQMLLRNISKYLLLWILYTTTIRIGTEKWNPSEDTPVAQFYKLKTKFQQGHPSCFELKTQNKIQAKTSQFGLVQGKTKLKEGHLSRFLYPSWAACWTAGWAQ